MSTTIAPSRDEARVPSEPAPRLRLGLIPHAARGRDYALLALLAVAAFALESLAWPFFAGRDAQSYLMYYLDMGSADPVFPLLMLFRPPLVPLLLGMPLDLGGPAAAEIVMAICYVVSILAVYTVGAFWSRWIGLIAAGAVLVYPGYAAIFHSVSPDGLYATGIVLWAVLICATSVAPTTGKFALHGAAVFLLVMVRPAGLALAATFALFPLLLAAPWRKRLLFGAAYVGCAGALLLGWSAYNSARYGDFTVSRMNSAQVPLHRALVVDRLVEPENGDASREFARAVERDLLRHEPYRSYGVDLDEFLHEGVHTTWSDVPALADRTWGWDDDYGKLREVGMEAVAAHPSAYARGVATTVWDQLTSTRYQALAPKTPPPPRTFECEGCFRNKGFIMVRGRRLPKPIPEEPVPRGYFNAYQSTPDESIGSDWSSFSRPRFEFRRRDVAVRYRRLNRRLREMMGELPSRDGRDGVARRLNQINYRFPPMLAWLVLGIVGLLLRPLRQSRVLVFLCALSVVAVVSAALGWQAYVWYRLPFDPLFVLFGVAGGISLAAALAPRVRNILNRRRLLTK
jgi:hypothetical protein